MTNERASPICFAAQADDIYMGFAGRDALIAALGELSRLTGGLVDSWLDGKSWLTMLQAEIARLGGHETAETDAGAVPADGAAFLHDRLGGLLPRVRDDRLHGRLRDMRTSLGAYIAAR